MPTQIAANKHVVVIGAGIVGLSSAEALLNRGYRVTVLDRAAAPDRECSFGNGGLIVPSHFVPLAAPGMVATGIRMMFNSKSPFGLRDIGSLEVLGWIARFMRASTILNVTRAAPILRDLNMRSRDEFERIVGQLGIDVGYARRGLLMLCRTPAGLDSEAHLAKDANSLGLRADVLDPAGLAALDPAISMSVAGGVYFHDDAHLTPAAFMPALAERVEKLGGEIRRDVEITGFQAKNGRVERAGEYEGDEFVLAAGIWSADLGNRLGLRLPMLAGKGYGITDPCPPEKPRIPSILTEARIAVTPMTDGLRFVGTMELGRPNDELNL